VRHVYNYDMPNVPENYVHRIGRTARAGADGTAVAFCAPAEMDEFQAIEKMLKTRIPVLGGAAWSMAAQAAAPKPVQGRGGRPQGGAQGKPAGRSAGPKPSPKPGAKPAHSGRPATGGGYGAPSKPGQNRRPSGQGQGGNRAPRSASA